jgi:hypothetical protein
MTGGFLQDPYARDPYSHINNISNTTGSGFSQQSYSGASAPDQHPYYHHQRRHPGDLRETIPQQTIYPLVSTVEDMAELQQDLIDENSRLRQEVQRIETMFEKIEKTNRQNKLERAHIKEEKDNLKL